MIACLSVPLVCPERPVKGSKSPGPGATVGTGVTESSGRAARALIFFVMYIVGVSLWVQVPKVVQGFGFPCGWSYIQLWVTGCGYWQLDSSSLKNRTPSSCRAISLSTWADHFSFTFWDRLSLLSPSWLRTHSLCGSGWPQNHSIFLALLCFSFWFLVWLFFFLFFFFFLDRKALVVL